MKIAVEYMKHLVDGVLVNPEWIIAGDFFPDNINNTYIGIVLDRSSRDYYIPSTLKIMNKFSIQSRNLNIEFPGGTSDNDNLTHAHEVSQAWIESNNV